MFTRRKLAGFGILGAAALALIGIGTGATFTDSGQAEKQINAGTLAVAVTPLMADGVTEDPGAEVVITHPQAGPHAAYVRWTLKNVGSEFQSIKHVRFTNIGTLPLKLGKTTFDPTGRDDEPLASQVVASVGGMSDAWYEPVRWLEDAPWTDGDYLGVGESVVYNFHFKAQAGGLTNEAMGQTITPMFGFLNVTEQAPGLTEIGAGEPATPIK